jgi:CBS domain-containing protein
MKALKVKDIMTPDPFMVKPSLSVKEAAKRMKDIDCGVLPVGDPDKVVGIITDRDITLRVTAEGRDPGKVLVEEVMTKRVRTCDEDADIEEAAEAMREHSVARLIVTRGKKVTGIVNMTCLLKNKGDKHKSDRVLHALLKSQGDKPAAKRKSACGSC